jgi:hypothetical protein
MPSLDRLRELPDYESEEAKREDFRRMAAAVSRSLNRMVAEALAPFYLAASVTIWRRKGGE